MKKLSRLIILVLIVTSLTSCDWLMEVYGIRKRRSRPVDDFEESEELVQEVESTDLAKLIIKPTPKVLKVKRDPFKPLIGKKRKTITSGDATEEEDALDDVSFLGVVRVGDNFSALLRTSEAKGAFNIGEKIGVYTISEITQEYVIFTKGDKTYKIKRGDEQ